MRVAILALDRARALGEQHRIADWEQLLVACGHESFRVSLRSDHTTGLRPFKPPDLGAVLLRGTAPESLGWSRRSAFAELAMIDPEAIIVVTSRCFHPDLTELTPLLIVDFVDKLSDSYQERASRVGGSRSLAFRTLARTMRRTERMIADTGALRIAAGRADAAALEARWIPLLVEPPDRVPARDPDIDLLFFGNLSYAPNIAAIEALARCWPALTEARPDLTLRVAGRYASDTVHKLVDLHGWDLAENFPSVPEICARARVGVAPIPGASGIQTKVLEAAAQSLPQIITPAVAAGLSEDFPAVIAPDDEAFVAAVLHLCEDSGAADELGRASWQHVREHFTVDTWAGVVEELLSEAPQ